MTGFNRGDHLRLLIENALKSNQDGNNYDGKSMAELLEQIHIYHQELEYQNEELRRVNLELETARNNFSDLFQNAPVGYVLLDSDMHIRKANKWFCDKFNYVHSNSGKMFFTDFVHPQYQDSLYLAVRNLKKSGNDQSASLSLKMKYHSLVMTALIYIFFRSHDDEETLRIAITDITEKEHLYQELQKSEKRFSEVAEITDEIIWETDSSGMLIYLSGAFSKVLGFPAEEFTRQKYFYELTTPEFIHELKEVMEDIYNRRLPIIDLETVCRSSSGEFVHLVSSAIPVYSPDGKFTGYRGAARDLTSEKKMMLSLIDAKNKAEQMMKLKSYFLANMSHEIRTPLVAILGYADLIESETSGSSSEINHFAKSITSGGHRLLDTLTMILNLSKIESESDNIRWEVCNVVSLLRDIFVLFLPIAQKKSLHMHFEPDLEVINCRIDRSIFSNIFNNLLNNAVKFTETGEIMLSVRIENDKAVIEVEDTGLGIEEDQQLIIWEEFRQASEGISRGFEGTGLGLTLVKKYCEIIHAEVFVSSMKDVGSIFTVTIPLSGETSVTYTRDESAESAIESFIRSQKITLLYIEDDHISSDFVKRILHNLYDVETTPGFAGAVELLQHKQYDGFLIDLNLRTKLSGVDFAKFVKSDPLLTNLPRIAITAYGTEHPEYDTMTEYFNLYISKPFKKREFIDRLNKFFYNLRNENTPAD